MKPAKILALCAALVLLAGGSCRPAQPVPPGYPSSYGGIVSAGESEGLVTIYGTIGAGRVDRLIAAFQARHPKIRIAYFDLPGREANARAIAESEGPRATADVIWSSAMDLQIKLVNDGYAQRYASPEREHLPSWGVWKEEAYGTTAERVVFAYNRNAISDREAPRTHGEFARLAARPDLRGRIATYDPALSAVGYLFMREDAQASGDTWRLVEQLGRARAQLFDSSDPMLRSMSSGETVLAYNVIGSYAQKRQRRDSVIGFVVPQDYTLLISRIALITREAPHPNAARLFLDFLLSREGQALLAEQSVQPIREDVELPAHLRARTGQRRAIRVGPALLTHLDQLTRERFLARWKTAYAGAVTGGRTPVAALPAGHLAR